MNRKRSIRNPHKWLNKYVRHMGNWREFQWAYDQGYFVCEFTGKLTKVENEAYWGEVWATKEDAVAAGYDECYSYSEEGLLAMYWKHLKAS
jgi:hypothetical protein